MIPSGKGHPRGDGGLRPERVPIDIRAVLDAPKSRQAVACADLAMPPESPSAMRESHDEGTGTGLIEGVALDRLALLASLALSCYGCTAPVEKVSSTEAKNQLNRLLADVKAGNAFIITSHGEPVAQLIPIVAVPRRFRQLPNLVVPSDFDDALPEDDLAAWECDRG